jgi:DNA-binding NarL/FixJ family response regulator
MVKNQSRVVIFGNSLHMSGIATSLRAYDSLEVVCFDPASPAARQQLTESDPAAIAFDLNSPSTGIDLKLLRELPGLLLIGVDSSRDELLVLSSYTAQALSMDDLVRVIQAVQPLRKETNFDQ